MLSYLNGTASIMTVVKPVRAATTSPMNRNNPISAEIKCLKTQWQQGQSNFSIQTTWGSPKLIYPPNNKFTM